MSVAYRQRRKAVTRSVRARLRAAQVELQDVTKRLSLAGELQAVILPRASAWELLTRRGLLGRMWWALFKR